MFGFNVEKVSTIIRDVSATKIMPRFKSLKRSEIENKKDTTLVTIADKEAEKELERRLSELLPGSSVVGEEAFAANSGIFNRFLDDAPVWIIDPIDGTGNFVSGNPLFGVMVALAKKDKVIAGWIYHPSSDEFVTAELGSGAYYEDRRLKVLEDAPLIDMLGMFYDDDVLAAGNGRPKDTRPNFADPIMSCSHEFPCLVVEGKHFDKNLRQMHFMGMGPYSTPWDLAPGVLIHAEAGGFSAFWNKTPFSPSAFPIHYHKPFLSATSGDAWAAIHEWVQRETKL